MKKESLFELIKKMKQTEKAYFKKTSFAYKKGSKNNFIYLFELIEKQNTYDEYKLKKIIGTKHFAQKKQHLNKKILESLKNYYSKDSTKTQIEALLHEFRIYMSKSMFQSAEKSIKKAKKLSLKTENYQLYLHVLKNEIELLKNKNDLKKINDHLNSYKITAKNINKIVYENIQLEELHLSIILWNNKMEYIRSKEQLLKLRSIFKKHNKGLDASKSIRSKCTYYYTVAIYNYLQGNHKESYNYFHKQLELFQSTSWLKEEMSDYIRSLANNCFLSIILNNESTYQKCFNELNIIQTEDLFLKMILQYYQHLLTLKYYTYKREYNKAIELIELTEDSILNIEKNIIKKNILQNEMMIMTFSKIEAYVLGNNASKALKVINTYLNYHNKALKSDTYITSRLLNVIIHYELNNYEYIEYEIDSIKKWLKDKKVAFKLERSILGYIEHLLFINKKKDSLTIHQNIINKINKLKQDPFEKAVITVFDFERWIQHNLIKN